MGCDESLSEMENKWKEDGTYDDVKAVFWDPAKGPNREEICPKCSGRLQRVAGGVNGWKDVPDRHRLRQVWYCSDDRYARIYVISVATARERHWDPKDDV